MKKPTSVTASKLRKLLTIANSGVPTGPDDGDHSRGVQRPHVTLQGGLEEPPPAGLLAEPVHHDEQDDHGRHSRAANRRTTNHRVAGPPPDRSVTAKAARAGPSRPGRCVGQPPTTTT